LSSSNQAPPQTLQQFIESQNTQYAISKGTQASNEYIAIITPYVNQIVSLESQLKAALEKIPKKERIKIIKQKKKKGKK
jgi:hypothetical protein